jgi:hypothetical protein
MSDIEIIQLRPYQLPGRKIKIIGLCSAPSTGTTRVPNLSGQYS